MHGPFIFPVGDLLTHPGTRRSVPFAGDLEVESEYARLVGPVTGGAVLEGLVNGVYASIDVRADVEFTCNRCLRPFASPLQVEFSQVFAGELDEDGYKIDHDRIDLEPPLRDEVTLALPLVPLCRPECKGLCAICGADLNTEPCTGHAETEASPFAVLKDMISD